MKIKNILKLIIVTIIVLIAFGISTVSNAVVESNQYKITSEGGKNYILGIYQSTRVDVFKKNIITAKNVDVYNNKNQKVEDIAIIETGNKIKIGEEEYIAIVCGDTNGDGKAGLTDLVNIKQYLIGKEQLTNEKEVAADIDVSKKVSSTDILNLKRLIVRIIEERQIYENEYTNEEYVYKKNRLTEKVAIVKLANNKKSGVLQIPNKIDGADVTKIEDFLGENKRITRVTIPTNVESISNVAFSGMEKLATIETSKLNKNYSSENGVLYNKEGTKLVSYPRGKEETEYKIEETVKEIGEYAFYKNNKIEKIYIPESIEQVSKTAFEEMKGQVYVTENSKVKNILTKEGIAYKIDKAPRITKLTYNIGTNQAITVNIEATDEEGIIAWNIAAKGRNEENWKQISSTKSLRTTYDEINQNGTYVLKVKDKAGNIGSKEVTITEIDQSKPKVISMKIISPTSGEYKPGQKIIVRVDFSEKIKGTAPTLKLKIGNEIGTGSMSSSKVTGNTKYIDYTYVTNDKQTGKVEIYSYSGGSLTDLNGNKLIIAKMANSGNAITIKPNYNPKYPVYNYPISGTVVASYKDDSIQVSVEKVGKLYLSKIWIADPSKQINKAVANPRALVGDMVSGIPGVIIATNASYDTSKAGRVIITNGQVTAIHDEDESHYMLGIDKNGKLIQRAMYRNTASLKGNKSAQELLDMGIVNTFPSWPGSIIENGKKRSFNIIDLNTDHRARTAIGQINDNNYVIISAKDGTEGVPLRPVGDMGWQLGCQMFFILDGGGSTQLWMRGQYIIPSSRNRPRDDAIYFTTLE